MLESIPPCLMEKNTFHVFLLCAFTESWSDSSQCLDGVRAKNWKWNLITIHFKSSKPGGFYCGRTMFSSLKLKAKTRIKFKILFTPVCVLYRWDKLQLYFLHFSVEQIGHSNIFFDFLTLGQCLSAIAKLACCSLFFKCASLL